MTFSAESRLHLSFPITQADRLTARRFAAQQPTPHKAEQVYRNSLAVLSTRNYLRLLGIETDPEAGDSWNPAVRFFADVADLPIVGYGTLECRPVATYDRDCYVPAEVRDSERLGYVVVQLDEQCEAATFLGFAETAASEFIPLAQLDSIERLIDRLSRSYAIQTAWADLRQWLNNTVESGWESVESLLSPAPQLLPVRGQAVAEAPTAIDNTAAIAPVLRLLQPNQAETIRRHAASVLGEIGSGNPDVIYALVDLIENTSDEETRWQASLSLGKLDPDHPLGGIRRVKRLDLGETQVLFLVALMPKPQHRLGVDIQLEAAGESSVLPPGLSLSVLANGQTRTAVTARSDDHSLGMDKSLRRRFSPPPGTEFQVKIEWGDIEKIETFIA
jgi:hypothetical protein